MTLDWPHWALIGGVSAGLMLALLTGEPALFLLGFVGGALVGGVQYWAWSEEYRKRDERRARQSRAERQRELPERVRYVRRGALLLALAVATVLALAWLLAGRTPGPAAAVLFAPSAFFLAWSFYMEARGE